MRKLMVLILAIAAAVPALAQTTSTTSRAPSANDIANRQVKTLTALLSLTSAQQQQATTIFTNAAEAQQPLMASNKEAHDTLRTAIKSNDGATIDRAANTIAQNTAQLTSIKAKADAVFYQVLTSEQQTKLSELESQHMGPLDGPGGFGPPGMGQR